MLKISRFSSVAQQIRSSVAPFCTPTKGKVILQQERDQIAQDKATLEWREPLAGKEWSTKFGLFARDNENVDFITILQQPWDLSYSGVKSWYAKKKLQLEKGMQAYIPERHEMLGSDLAAAHFIVFRGGRVRFVGQKDWIERQEDDDFELNLPKNYDRRFRVEAMDCSRMQLYYEGLVNIRHLFHLKWLSFEHVKFFDDWCLDRVSGSKFEQLEELDLRGTSITAKSLCCLYRLPELKTLHVDLPREEEAKAEMKLGAAMLEEALPKLSVNLHPPDLVPPSLKPIKYR
ncbi:distal membrane-arm assembly complex protein 2 [Sergentomyia squamirostris]